MGYPIVKAVRRVYEDDFEGFAVDLRYSDGSLDSAFVAVKPCDESGFECEVPTRAGKQRGQTHTMLDLHVDPSVVGAHVLRTPTLEEHRLPKARCRTCGCACSSDDDSEGSEGSDEDSDNEEVSDEGVGKFKRRSCEIIITTHRGRVVLRAWSSDIGLVKLPKSAGTPWASEVDA